MESSWNRLLYRGVNKRAKCRNKGTRLWKLREIILGLDEISKRVGYLDPTFPTRAKSGYEGMRIASYTGSKPISARAFSSCSSNCSFLSPLSSLPFSLSLTFFPPLNSASFERLDNENRSRVSVLKRVLNECLEGKVNAIAPRGTHGKLSFPFRRISKNCSSNEEERNRKVLSSAYFLRGNDEVSNGRLQKFQIGAERHRKKERERRRISRIIEKRKEARTNRYRGRLDFDN